MGNGGDPSPPDICFPILPESRVERGRKGQGEDQENHSGPSNGFLPEYRRKQSEEGGEHEQGETRRRGHDAETREKGRNA